MASQAATPPTPPASTPAQPPADRKPSAISSSVSRTELGCLLGAFRDVAHSIGMQVLAVILRARGEGETRSATRGETALPKGRSRKELKLIALVQTFADNVAHEGYVLENIDMKPVSAEDKLGDRKNWRVKVEIKGPPVQ